MAVTNITFPTPRFDFSGGFMVITSPFGPRWGAFHYGNDIGTSDGIEVGVDLCAVEDGVIIRIGDFEGGAGNNLWLLGDSGFGWKYFHMLEQFVVAGQRVKRGQHIGDVGGSGGVAPHLHLQKHNVQGSANWGRWGNETAIDPGPDLRAAQARNDFMYGINVIPIPEEIDMPNITEAQLEQLRVDTVTETVSALSGRFRVEALVEGRGDWPYKNGYPDLELLMKLIQGGENLDQMEFQVLINTLVGFADANGFSVNFDSGKVTVSPK